MGGLDVSESSVVAIGPNRGLETNRAVRSSNFYGSFEVTPVFFGEELRAYMSSDSELYTNAGVMFKLHVGVFLR
jgi:predicted lipase